MLPIYKLTINPNDEETGVDYNAFVDVPAHLKNWIAFNKHRPSAQFFFNEEKRIVTGVMISSGTPIYRRDPEIGEHYVFFDKTTIEHIRDKFHKQNRGALVNLMHDPKQKMNGVFMVESFIVDRTKGKTPPTAFNGLNLQDGTWIASYKIENNVVWNMVKTGKFQGFSVEGMFERSSVNVKSKLSNMKKPNFWDRFSKNPQKFATVKAADGTVLMYEGESIEAGKTAVFIEADGQQIPAPEGEYSIPLEGGGAQVITVNANGIAETVEDVSGEEMSTDEILEEVSEAVTEAMTAVNERFEKVEKENADLRREIETLKKGGAAGAAGGGAGRARQSHRKGAATADAGRLTFQDIINNRKKGNNGDKK